MGIVVTMQERLTLGGDNTTGDDTVSQSELGILDVGRFPGGVFTVRVLDISHATGDTITCS